MPERKQGDIALVRGAVAMRVQFDWDSHETTGWVMPDGKVFPDSKVDGEIGPTLWNVHDIAKAAVELWPEIPEEIREDLHGAWTEREEMIYWHGRAVGHAWNDVARKNGRSEVIRIVNQMHEGSVGYAGGTLNTLIDEIKAAFPDD